MAHYRLSANCQPTLDPRSPNSQTCENAKNFGRGDWIRTSDPLRPRQVRYQAALRPDLSTVAYGKADSEDLPSYPGLARTPRVRQLTPRHDNRLEADRTPVLPEERDRQRWFRELRQA